MFTRTLLILVAVIAPTYSVPSHAQANEESARLWIGSSVVLVRRIVGACHPQFENADRAREVMATSVEDWSSANWPEINALRFFHAAYARFTVESQGVQVANKMIAYELARYRDKAKERLEVFSRDGFKANEEACSKFFTELKAGKYPISEGQPDVKVFTEKYQGRTEHPRLYFDILPVLMKQ